jgi:hypothetical protein
MHDNAESQHEQPEEPAGFFLSKQTIDVLLRHKRGADMIALLVFYSYTATWQQTDQPRATVDFVAKGLNWGLDKVREIRNLLREAGFIEDIAPVDERGKKKGWFVRLCHFHPRCFPEGGEVPSTLGVSPPLAKHPPKCLKADKRKCLKANKGSRGSAAASAFPELPEPIDTPGCQQAWAEWLLYRRESRQKVMKSSAQKQIAELRKWGPTRMITAIEHSIRQGYRGIYEPKSDTRTALEKKRSREFEEDFSHLDGVLPEDIGTPHNDSFPPNA